VKRTTALPHAAVTRLQAGGYPSPESLLTRLPWIDPQNALAGNRVILALANLDFSKVDPPLTPMARRGQACNKVWMRFDAAGGILAIAPRTLNGVPTAWPGLAAGPLLPEALTRLSQLEFVIESLERSLALSLEILDPAPPPTLQLELDLFSEGAMRHRLGVAVDLQTALAWRTPTRRNPTSARIAGLHTVCQMALAGPLVSPIELGRLELGDIILVPMSHRRTWVAKLRATGSNWVIYGEHDPSRDIFDVSYLKESHMADMADLETTASAETAQPERVPAPGSEASKNDVAFAETKPAIWSSELPVRLHILLTELTVAVSDLCALGPGYILPLSPGPEIKVRVMANGMAFASGQLVALGDAYGVLIDHVDSVQP